MTPRAILGISAFYHDSAAALLVDGEIVAAAQEERFTRRRHDAAFPLHACRYVLDASGFSLDALAAVAFYDKPLLKFERLLETYHGFAPRGVRSFVAAMPVWIKEKLFMRRLLAGHLADLGAGGDPPRVLYPEHHLSHAASAFYPSPFDEAAILTVDGVGEWATATIAHGRGRDITLRRELRFPHSVGLLYSAFTYFLGFRVNSGEYKLMGLAPYGNPEGERTRRFREAITRELVDLRPDGSILLNMRYFDYATGLRMAHDARWAALFGLPRRTAEGEITQAHMDLALAIQQVTEEIVLRLARTARDLTGCRRLVLAGGVALNCVANGKLLAAGVVDDLWIQPAAGDAGGAVGAALAAWHIHEGRERPAPGGRDAMHGAYLGPVFGDAQVTAALRRFGAPATRHASLDALVADVAARLDAGQVGGWFQGRMEFGPRALGNRSILGDPRSPEMQKRLNLKIKFREGFRPFAPAVLAGDLDTCFALDRPSPYMLLVAPVVEARRTPRPEGYADLPLYERLYHPRSDLPAVTHVDDSARIQTVHPETNPEFHALLEAFKARTGVGVLVNTSFNVRGEPIVCTPEDAYRCFMRTEMDFLAIGPYVLDKPAQPVFDDAGDWRREFTPD